MTLKVIRNTREWLLVCGIQEMWVKKFLGNEERTEGVGELKFVAKVMDDKRPDKGFTEIVYKDDAGEWNQVQFNTEAYVCNDFGKTVEKIYG